MKDALAYREIVKRGHSLRGASCIREVDKSHTFAFTVIITQYLMTGGKQIMI